MDAHKSDRPWQDDPDTRDVVAWWQGRAEKAEAHLAEVEDMANAWKQRHAGATAEKERLVIRLAEIEVENEQLRLALQFFRENAGLTDTA